MRIRHWARTLKALLLFLRIDWLLARRGFAATCRWVQERPTNSRPTFDGDPFPAFEAVQSATRLYVRWRRDCLPKALTTFKLLQQAGAPAVMCMGVRHFPFEAHAWVECSGVVLDDRPSRIQSYKILRRLRSPEAQEPQRSQGTPGSHGLTDPDTGLAGVEGAA